MKTTTDQPKPTCQHCGRPGGRVVLDPYSLEMSGDKIKMRLHEHCMQARVDNT